MTVLEQRTSEAIIDIARSLRKIEESLATIAENNRAYASAEKTYRDIEKLCKMPKVEENMARYREYFEKTARLSKEERETVCEKLNEDIEILMCNNK